MCHQVSLPRNTKKLMNKNNSQHISNIHDCPCCCPLLHFTECMKMLCKALLKSPTAQGPQLPCTATPVPHSHTEAMENSDPLSEQGSARVWNRKAEIQTGVAFLRGLRDFHRRLLSDCWGSMAIFVAKEKGVKLRGG